VRGPGGKAERKLVFRQTCPENNFRPPRLEDPPEHVRGPGGKRSGNWFSGKLVRKIIPVRPQGWFAGEAAA